MFDLLVLCMHLALNPPVYKQSLLLLESGYDEGWAQAGGGG